MKKIIGLVCLVLFISSCDSESNDSIFTNGGKTLHASVVTKGSSKITTVKDDNNKVLLTTTLDKDRVVIRFLNADEKTTINFSKPVNETPSDNASIHLAVFIAGQMENENSSLLRQDNPGCDWFPDTNCTLGCCAQHDQCYSENNCSASSWLPIFGSEACDNCNNIVAACIARGCTGDDANNDEDQCYDNRCNEFFSCTDSSSCNCASPCDITSPLSCGNGTCEVGENPQNCFADCLEGAGINQCCASTNNCPSEEEYECMGGCCCCGLGETCSAEGVCAPGDPFLITGLVVSDKISKMSKSQCQK